MKATYILFLASVCLTGYSFGAEVNQIFGKELPTLPDNQETVMLTVKYGPGESTPPHRHNAHTYVYLLEGSVGMQVEGGELEILKTGDTFYELPTDIHTVSKNMSETESATLMVMLIKTAGAPITTIIEGRNTNK